MTILLLLAYFGLMFAIAMLPWIWFWIFPVLVGLGLSASLNSADPNYLNMIVAGTLCTAFGMWIMRCIGRLVLFTLR